MKKPALIFLLFCTLSGMKRSPRKTNLTAIESIEQLPPSPHPTLKKSLSSQELPNYSTPKRNPSWPEFILKKLLTQ